MQPQNQKERDGWNFVRATETIFPFVTINDAEPGTELTIRLDPSMPFHTLHHNVLGFVRASGSPLVGLVVNSRIEFWRDNNVVAQLRNDISVQGTAIIANTTYGLPHNSAAAASGTIGTNELNVYHRGVVGRYRTATLQVFAHADRLTWVIESNTRTAADVTNGSSFFLLCRSSPAWLP